MPRWLWWLPLGVLTLVAALLVFRQGWIIARLSETDVISHYAQRHIARHGGRPEACSARPAGQAAPEGPDLDLPGLRDWLTGAAPWLLITCAGADRPGGRHYLVDRRGRLIRGGVDLTPPADAPRI